MTLDGVQVTIDPGDETRATADVRSSHTCTPESGGQDTTTDEHDLFSLRKVDDTWVVDSTRPARRAAAAQEP
jgi:hypothetical protein